MYCDVMVEAIKMLFQVMDRMASRRAMQGWVMFLQLEVAILGINMGHPIVTNGTLWHSCVETCEVSELPFGVVSMVSPRNGVLDGGSHLPWGREGFGGFSRPFICTAFLCALVTEKHIRLMH